MDRYRDGLSKGSLPDFVSLVPLDMGVVEGLQSLIEALTSKSEMYFDCDSRSPLSEVGFASIPKKSIPKK